MTERARAVGGTFEITSDTGKGTTVRIVMMPNGFLVAVFHVDDAQGGDVFNLDDPNTPAWSVVILTENTINVRDEVGVIVGTCSY